MNKANYINHVLFVVDASGSMSSHKESVIKVFDNQVAHLAEQSKKMDQETRVTVFTFNTGYTAGQGQANQVNCAIYDKDVLRLPSLRSFYHTDGGTPLIDATLQSLNDLAETPERYGDHAFLCYIITDGEENRSNNSAAVLAAAIKHMPENWTIAALVPDANGQRSAASFGFSSDNISVWNTRDAKGFEDVGRKIQATTDTWMTCRAQGVRGTKSLFAVGDTSKLLVKDVQKTLDRMRKGTYVIDTVRRDSPIREYVENSLGMPYVKGNAYYQLTKTEEVQDYKDICVRNKATDEVYGGVNARKMLSLPAGNFKIKPGDFNKFDIFIQSTSINRKLPKGTDVLVIG